MPSLANYNTFGVTTSCRTLSFINNIDDLLTFDYQSPQDLFILGGGSNVLLVDSIERHVIINAIEGRKIITQDEDFVTIYIGGGENWHEAVLWTLEEGFGGLENLSLIPGTVGAAPIQNIGAYGVELKDVLSKVHAVDLIERKELVFDKQQCEFSYRDSIFKHAPLKGNLFITGIEVALHKDRHLVNTSYGAIQTVLNKKGIDKPTIKDVSDVVISIRQSKLPNPKVLGNSGSFFKNPILKKKEFTELQSDFPDIPSYPVDESQVKVPAAWLIDQCGWKGSRIGNVGNYKNQALILVNYGDGTGQEIYTHARNIQQSVLDVFNIQLDMEVNVIQKK